MVILYKPWDIVTFSLHIYSFTKTPFHFILTVSNSVKTVMITDKILDSFLSGNLLFFSLPSCLPWPAPGVGCGEIFMPLRLYLQGTKV